MTTELTKNLLNLYVSENGVQNDIFLLLPSRCSGIILPYQQIGGGNTLHAGQRARRRCPI
ncbi:MAG: hypothetical protein ACLTD4_08870 [Hungatella sp.]